MTVFENARIDFLEQRKQRTLPKQLELVVFILIVYCTVYSSILAYSGVAQGKITEFWPKRFVLRKALP